MARNGGLGASLALLLVAVAAVAVLAWRSDADAAPRFAAQETPTPEYPIPTPTPTPSPTPTPRASLELLIVAVRPPALHGRTLSWTVRCAPRSCRATFRVRLLVRGHRAMRLSPVHHRVSATHDVRVEHRISRAQVAVVRRAWRRHRRVIADLRAKATDRRGHTASFRLKTRLRRPHTG